MKQVKTISAKVLTHGNKTFDPTLKIYREALTFLVEAIDKEWEIIEGLTTKDVTRLVERLVHRTKKNPSPKYDFTSKFYKFPSYLRRSAISKAYGIVSSYRSNLENWLNEKLNAQSEGKRFKKKPPALSIEHDAFPVFYKKEICSNDFRVMKQILKFLSTMTGFG